MPDTPRCGYTVIDANGEEQPCDHPAPAWRWYQGVRVHGDCLEPACSVHMNEGGQRLHTAESEVQKLRAGDATLEVIHLRREVEGQLRLQREMGALQNKIYAELERLRAERDTLSSLLRGMARRVGTLRREVKRTRSLADTFQRYLDKSSDEIDHLRDSHREAIANRDSNVNRLLGRLAAVRALADKAESERFVMYGGGRAPGSVPSADLLAVLDGPAEASAQPDVESLVKAALDRQRADIVAWLRRETTDDVPVKSDRYQRGWLDAYEQAANDLEAAGPAEAAEPAPDVLVCTCTTYMRGRGRRCEGCKVDDANEALRAAAERRREMRSGSVTTTPDRLTFELFERLVRLAHAAHLEWYPIQKWRLGQAYSNVLHTLAPRIQERMEKSGRDVFYRDDLIPAYLAEVRAALSGSPQPGDPQPEEGNHG